jgi:hypothetical protein
MEDNEGDEGRNQSAKAKEERDIGQISTLTVKRTLYSRLSQADPIRL